MSAEINDGQQQKRKGTQQHISAALVASCQGVATETLNSRAGSTEAVSAKPCTLTRLPAAPMHLSATQSTAPEMLTYANVRAATQRLAKVSPPATLRGAC
jgi:hypothetical protein